MKNNINYGIVLYVGLLSFNILSSCSNINTKEKLGIGSHMLNLSYPTNSEIGPSTGTPLSILEVNDTTTLQPVGMDLATQSRILSAINSVSPTASVNRSWFPPYKVYILLRNGTKHFLNFDKVPKPVPIPGSRYSGRGATQAKISSAINSISPAASVNRSWFPPYKVYILLRNGTKHFLNFDKVPKPVPIPVSRYSGRGANEVTKPVEEATDIASTLFSTTTKPLSTTTKPRVTKSKPRRSCRICYCCII